MSQLLDQYRRLICALALLCFCADARALDPGRMMSQYVRERWDVDKGFSGGVVHAISQTKDGYLWIGTDDGLFRFDGFSFRRVSAFGPVLDLTTDGDGDLLVRLQGAVLLHKPDGQFENVDSGLGVTTSYVTAMYRESNGDVLISDLVTGILRFQAMKFKVLVPQSELHGPPIVNSMAQASPGKLWMGTLGAGLLYLTDGRIRAAPVQIPERKVNCLLSGDDQQLWIGTDEGLFRWDGAKLTLVELPYQLEHVQILALLRDHNSNVWAGNRTRTLSD